MQKNSTIFLNNLTQIDYAFIHPKNNTLSGGSLNLSVEVTGAIDKYENVVVDFSNIEKYLKESINARESGFDHKLWVLPNHGNKTDINNWNDEWIDKPDKFMTALYSHNGRVMVATPKIQIQLPTSAIKICKYDDYDILTKNIELYLEEQLRFYYLSDFKIKCFLSVVPTLPYNNSYGHLLFRYTHGLKNSSSWGCQNIAHGHLSWILFTDKFNNYISLSNNFASDLLNTLDNHMFICKDNIAFEDKDYLILEYATFDRGLFTMRLLKNHIKYTIIDTETTVENLTVWFKDRYSRYIKYMKEKGAYNMYFSEGLVKGSCISLYDENGN